MFSLVSLSLFGLLWGTVVSWGPLGGDINGEAAGDKLGTSVSLSADGTILAIGAPLNDGTDDDAGHVRVYKWNAAIWNQLGADINGEAFNDRSGSSVSLSADGTIVAIGAPFNDGPSSLGGHVRVYKWNTATWNQLGTDIDGEAAGDNSGYSVSLSADGTILAIGAIFNNNNRGHVRVYKWNTATWNKVGADIDGEATGDYFGYTVSLSSDGTILAVGAPYNANYRGHVRVYKWNTATWNQLGADIDGETALDFSGYSVSLSADGTILAIGAIFNDGTGSDAGHVRVYKWNAIFWNQVGADIDGEAAGDFFGSSVSLSDDGTILAIGATDNDATGSNAGHVRVFKWDSTTWNQLGTDIDGEAAGDNSGQAVSLSADGSIVAVAAILNYGNGNEAGHVRVFADWATYPPTAEPTASPTSTSTSASPTDSPTAAPTTQPTANPSGAPTVDPSAQPTLSPTESPTVSPTESPTAEPTSTPTASSSAAPTAGPSKAPFARPSKAPTAKEDKPKRKPKPTSTRRLRQEG